MWCIPPTQGYGCCRRAATSAAVIALALRPNARLTRLSVSARSASFMAAANGGICTAYFTRSAGSPTRNRGLRLDLRRFCKGGQAVDSLTRASASGRASSPTLFMRTPIRAGWQGAKAAACGARGRRGPVTRSTDRRSLGRAVLRERGRCAANSEGQRGGPRPASALAEWPHAELARPPHQRLDPLRFEPPGVRSCVRCATCGRSASRDVPGVEGHSYVTPAAGEASAAQEQHEANNYEQDWCPRGHSGSPRSIRWRSKCGPPMPRRLCGSEHRGDGRSSRGGAMCTAHVVISLGEGAHCSIRHTRRRSPCAMIGAWATSHSRRNSASRSSGTPRSLRALAWRRPSRTATSGCSHPSRRQPVGPECDGPPAENSSIKVLARQFVLLRRQHASPRERSGPVWASAHHDRCLCNSG